MRPWFRVLVRRLVTALLLLFVVTALTFVLVSVTPGDAAAEILGHDAPPDAYPRLRHALGLDLPIYEQYWQWGSRALTGDLGKSLFSNLNVSDVINSHLPVTLSLAICSLLTIVLVGVSLGLLSAVWGGALGRIVDALSLVGFALPGFWLGAGLIVVFAVKLHWFPAVGYVAFAESPGGWLRSLTLPVVAIGLVGIASVAKQTRQGMLEVLSSEYIRMAWANGVPASTIYPVYALKNAAIPVVTVLGLHAIGLLGGTVLIENVFALPGLGSVALEAVLRHDLPMVQGIVVYYTVIVVIINLAIDISYTVLNPRVRTG